MINDQLSIILIRAAGLTETLIAVFPFFILHSSSELPISNYKLAITNYQTQCLTLFM